MRRHRRAAPALDGHEDPVDVLARRVLARVLPRTRDKCWELCAASALGAWRSSSRTTRDRRAGARSRCSQPDRLPQVLLVAAGVAVLCCWTDGLGPWAGSEPLLALASSLGTAGASVRRDTNASEVGGRARIRSDHPGSADSSSLSPASPTARRPGPKAIEVEYAMIAAVREPLAVRKPMTQTCRG